MPQVHNKLNSVLMKIPDTEEVRGSDIVFTDLEALSIAYKGSQNYFTGGDDISTGQKYWASLYSSWMFLLDVRVYVSYGDGSMSNVVGFDCFDINVISNYGNVGSIDDSRVLYISGNFNFNRIRDAYQELGFVKEEIAGTEVWRDKDGLSAEYTYNSKNRLVENPFGGFWGRKQPMVFGNDFIISSSNLSHQSQYFDKKNGFVRGILENPVYEAAVNSVPENCVFLQARIINENFGSFMNRDDYLGRGGSSLGIAFKTMKESIEEYGNLPVYDLFMISNYVRNKKDVTQLSFVYKEKSKAEAGAAEIKTRLNRTPSLFFYPDLVKNRLSFDLSRMTIKSDVLDNGNGYYIAVIILEAPQLTLDEYEKQIKSSKEENAYIRIINSNLNQMIFQGDILWLLTD